MAPWEPVEVQLMENFLQIAHYLTSMREKYAETIPDIMLSNFTDFASKYKMVNKKLTCYPDNIIHRVFPVILDCYFVKWSIVVSNQTDFVVVLGGRCAKWSFAVSNQTSKTNT